MRSFKDLGLKTDDSVFFIAEAGINHNGSIETAKELIRVAKESGADCVKFQKRTISRILTKEGLNKEYDNERSFAPEGKRTYGEHKKVLELTEESFLELFAYASEIGIMMTASGWDEEAVDFLVDKVGVPFLKMASADLTNFPLLEHAAKKGVPMVLSSGMSDMATVVKAVDLVRKHNPNIALMQCTSTYPTNDDDINLNVIKTYQAEFPDLVIGYSGHERGLTPTQAAVALGSKVVERHFTLDRTMKGGDHAASLEPLGLTRLINYIRCIERCLGTHVKTRLPAENACFIKLAKSVVSATAIPSGTLIERSMLTTKGPGHGISPMDLESLVGKMATVNIEEDVVLQHSMFER